MGWSVLRSRSTICSSLSPENAHLYFLNTGCSCVLVSSLMADKTNSCSKLSVVSRASQCQGICWWPIGLGLPFSSISFGYTDSLS